jgi:hypothetical protein
MTTTIVTVTVEVDHRDTVTPERIRDAVANIVAYSTARDAIETGLEAVDDDCTVSMFVPE